MTDLWAAYDDAVEQMRAAAIEYDAARARLRAALAALPDVAPEAAPEPQPDADGWIPFHGGGCPVAPDTRVQVLHLGGWVSPVMCAEEFMWWHGSEHGADQTITYRIVKPEVPNNAV